MRVLIINVAHATERMAFMQAQMQALGLQWERVEGVTPLTLYPPAEDPVWHRWQRPLRTTEMALCASHAAAWRRVLELGQPCLVLEDDAVLASETPEFLTGAEAVAGIDHISLETRARKKLVARRPHGTLPMRAALPGPDGIGGVHHLSRPARESCSPMSRGPGGRRTRSSARPTASRTRPIPPSPCSSTSARITACRSRWPPPR
jgi:glycosyl transferase family 25